MRTLLFIMLLLQLQLSEPQLLKAFMSLFPNIFHGPRGGGGGDQPPRRPSTPFIDDGTPEPVSTGRDEIFPADCGRNPHDGTGKLCFPDGILCKQSK